MPHGRITKATTEVTTFLLAGALIDPTGICLASAAAVAPFAAGGLAWHAAKGSITAGRSAYRERKARKETADEIAETTEAPREPSPTAHDEITPEMKVEYQECVRKIAAAATGLAIQGSLAAVMPHLSVVVVVNSVDLVKEVKKLRQLRKQDVHHAVSGLSQTEHVVIGVVLKMLATGVTLGHGDLLAMDAFVSDHPIGAGLSEAAFDAKVEAIFGGHNSLGLHIEGLADTTASDTSDTPPQQSATDTAVQMHEEMLQHPIPHIINAAANFAPDEVEAYLGLGDEWRPDEFADTDRHAGGFNVAVVGTVAAGMDVVITKVLEDPVHAVIDKAELLKEDMIRNREEKVDKVAVVLEEKVERDMEGDGKRVKVDGVLEDKIGRRGNGGLIRRKPVAVVEKLE